MALRPPQDFQPRCTPPSAPSDRELRALWSRHERAQHRRAVEVEWRHVVEEVRRRPDGKPCEGKASRPVSGDRGVVLGPEARKALRSLPREGRVVASGVDTWSPCWYAEPGSSLMSAMEALATRTSGRARMLPESVLGCRVGWFPASGLVFAEGCASKGGLANADELSGALARLSGALCDLGVLVGPSSRAGLRRLDVAVDLWTDSSSEGAAFVEAVSTVALGRSKVVAYRSDRRVESVLLTTPRGRTYGRIYDKGAELDAAPWGRWLRMEAQWRFPRVLRPSPESVDSKYLRERFWERFRGLWQSATGLRHRGVDEIGQVFAEAVDSGQLAASRARTLAGYLVLAAFGMRQGAPRTLYELERECRQLGLTVSLLSQPKSVVDVGSVLEECLLDQVWR